MPTANDPGATNRTLPSSRIVAPTGLDNADERLLKAARQGWRAIDRVLAIPALPMVPLEFANERHRNGQYQGNMAGDPIRITLSRGGKQPALTAIHEYGHYLDHQGLTRALKLPRDELFASESQHDKLTAWRAAVVESVTFRRLLTQRLPGTAEYQAARASGVRQHHLDYLLEDAELWARTFTQWVVIRSGIPRLLDQLQHATTANRVVYYQWSEDDFRPIAEAIDQFFADLGWHAPGRHKRKQS